MTESAERLRTWFAALAQNTTGHVEPLHVMLDAALAAERRATVERIRAALFDHPGTIKDYDKDGDYLCGCEWSHAGIEAILAALEER